MNIVKYIILENGVPVLFCPKIVHSDFVNKAVSSGFAIIDYNAKSDEFIVNCFGCCENLKVIIQNQDCSIIQDYLNSLFCK